MALKSNNARVFLFLRLILVSVFILAPHSVFAKNNSNIDTPLPNFNQFVQDVKNGNANQIRGIYAPALLADQVVQQPVSNPGFISPIMDVATEFSLPKNYGNIGILAHNYLAGQSFSSLAVGNELRIIYGDGRVEYFTVIQILRYQALQPDSTVSDFLDLVTGEKLSSQSVFNLVYTGPHHLTLQTCIAQGSNLEWGRLFVIASPASNMMQESKLALLTGAVGAFTADHKR